MLPKEPGEFGWLPCMVNGLLHFRRNTRCLLHYTPIYRERSWFAFPFLEASHGLHLDPRALILKTRRVTKSLGKYRLK